MTHWRGLRSVTLRIPVNFFSNVFIVLKILYKMTFKNSSLYSSR